MKEEPTLTPGNRPPPNLPIASCVRAEGKFLFISGQGPLDPKTGGWSRGSIGEQTRLTLERIKEIVESNGGSMDHVVSCRVFFQQLTERTFAEMNEAFAAFFGDTKPARTAVGCQLLNIDVEIDCIVQIP